MCHVEGTVLIKAKFRLLKAVKTGMPEVPELRLLYFLVQRTLLPIIFMKP